jgi:hydroxymethylglutaryl-CoA synthase
MAFCLDNEDINSICLTVLANLMEKYQIKPEEIGRLDVGTETLIDKSKSVKTTLMSLFEPHGCTDIEGIDNVNACFGGTAAIFNAINWIESSYWDGRYACVVMGDIAVYAKGSARPTGGAGAIAFLIGPHAELIFERGLRATHITHQYDFYKPVMDSEYPLVDGRLSIVCYLNALDKCYQLYKKKFQLISSSLLNRKSTNVKDKNNNTNQEQQQEERQTENADENTEETFSLNSADAFLFHSPYCKLVQKSFARLLWNDYLDLANQSANGEIDSLEQFKKLSQEESYIDKNLEKQLVKLSEPLFNKKTSASLFFAKEVGNMYTPSLYACLASYLLSKTSESLKNNRICLFSYGSGLASAMFSLKVKQNEANKGARFTLEKILSVLNEQKVKLAETRCEIEPEAYDAYLHEREQTHKQAPKQAKFSQETLYPGTWYLTSIDDKYRRSYDYKKLTHQFDATSMEIHLNQNLKSAL